MTTLLSTGGDQVIGFRITLPSRIFIWTQGFWYISTEQETEGFGQMTKS